MHGRRFYEAGVGSYEKQSQAGLVCVVRKAFLPLVRTWRHNVVSLPGIAATMENALATEIANSAARLVVEEGLEWGPAKRRAIKVLGLPARTPLPDNDLVEDAVREYLALFCTDTQPRELRALRELALLWMERMQAFRPYLGGAVWHGTATRLSDIYISLFCDDSKSAEIALIDRHVNYEPGSIKGLRGEQVDVLSVSSHSLELNEEIGVHLLIYDLDDLRGALRVDARGRVPRGGIEAVQRLLQQASSSLPNP